MVSVLRLHGVTPGAVLEGVDVVVPVVSDGSHVAEFALDHLGLDQGVTRDNARLPVGVALRALERGFVQALELAVLTGAGRQVLLFAIHISLKNPVANFIALSDGQQVLLGEGDLVGRRNVSIFEVRVLRDAIVLGILNRIVQVDVAVEENVSEVVFVDHLVGVTSI